jgi:hypothetical protein
MTAVGGVGIKGAVQQNLINHVALVLDASVSMRPHGSRVPIVADQLIQQLAEQSKQLDQETRVTVYTFGDHDKQKCSFYDKDVLRLPSLAGRYAPTDGSTALLDAVGKALDDLNKTAQLYGDHAFLVYILTDGEENSSRVESSRSIASRLTTLPENWTVAMFVPNARGKHAAISFGFQPDNIAMWDTTTVHGMEQVNDVIRAATSNYMSARSSGVRGTRSLFQLNQVSTTDLKTAGLEPLNHGQYRSFDVKEKVAIAEFVEQKTRRAYVAGEAFYQLSKSEIVQASKQLAIYDKKSHKLYVGANARKLVGLPDAEIRIAPSHHPDHTVFIQSMSVNRWLIPGTRLLLINRK